MWNNSPDGINTAFEWCFNPIGTIFANKEFTSLREIGFFGVRELAKGAFKNVVVSGVLIYPSSCKAVSDGCFFNATIDTIDIPASITYLAGTCFHSSKTKNIIFRSKTPPKLYGYQEFGGKIHMGKIYIPDDSIELYRTKWGSWLPFAPLSEYHP